MRPAYLRWLLVAALIVAALIILWNQGQHLIHGDSVSWTSYLLIVALVFGRYIPGVRFALNAALGGVIRMPYRTFSHGRQ